MVRTPFIVLDSSTNLYVDDRDDMTSSLEDAREFESEQEAERYLERHFPNPDHYSEFTYDPSFQIIRKD